MQLRVFLSGNDDGTANISSVGAAISNADEERMVQIGEPLRNRTLSPGRVVFFGVCSTCPTPPAAFPRS